MSGIKNKLKTLVSLMMIFAMILTSVPSMADEILDFQGTFQVFAGQNEQIGIAVVEIDDSMLTLHVTMEPDWPADAYSLYIVENEPTDRLSPGHAPLKNEGLDKATSFTIGPIDLSLPDLDPGQCLTKYLVLHVVSGTETAYPGDIIKPDKGPWFGFITVTICEPTITPTGSITLQKIVLNTEGEPLTTDSTPFNITITHPDSTTSTATINGNGTAPPLTHLPLGTYTISEVPPTDYTLQSINSGELTAANDLQITLSEADLDHHVTVTNRKSAEENPKTWSLMITKKVVDSQGQTLNNDHTTFAIKITGLTPLSNTDNTTFEHTIHLVGNATSPAIQIPGPGDYRISELAPTGYLLKSIQLGDTYLTDGVITLSESDHTTPIELTVTNQKEDAPIYKAALKLTKKVVDADHKPISTNDTFNIKIKYPDSSTHTHTLKGDGTPVTLNNLSPGIYTITEDNPEGYKLISLKSGDTTTDSALSIILSDHDHAQPVEVTVTNEREPEPPGDPDPPGEPDPPPKPQDKKGEIRVHKFLDTNQNNRQEPSEFDMQSITFELYAADKTTLLHSKKSDAAGDLTFANLRYGTYYLREVSDYTITSPSFSADGFSNTPITINSTQALTFNVGNYRDTTTEDVPPSPPPPKGPPSGPPTSPPTGPPDGPPETEIVEEEPPPLGAPPWEPPNELPPTGEAQAGMLNLLGTLLIFAGVFLKNQY